MNTKGLIVSGSVILVTVLFVVAYSLFNALGVTQSRVVRNEITLVTGSAEKLYDGTAISNEDWHMESGSLAEGDTLHVSMNTTLTYPDSIPNDIGVTILNGDGENVTVNYHIIKKLGTLTINPIELTISTGSASKFFDGAPLTNQEWTLQSGQLLSGDHISHVMNSTITDPGTIDNNIDISILNAQGDNVNKIYHITYNLGTLEILARDLTITTNSYEKVYDGSPLQGGSASITSGILADNHSIVYGPEQVITNPGSITNEREARIYDQDGNDVTSLYNITYDSGTLTVHALQLVIRSADDSKIYDGTPLSNSNWELVQGQLINSHELQVTVNKQITEVGSTENTIYAKIVDQSGNDVSFMYDIQYEPGTLTIDAKSLTIETGSASKQYDGTPLTLDDWSIVLGQLSPNHHIEYQMTSTITMPGEIDNKIFIQVLDDQNVDVSDQYDIQFEYGTLTVQGIPITISTNSYEKGYDGTPLFGGTASITNGMLYGSDTISFGAEKSITIPGSTDNSVDVMIYDSNGNDVTAAYNITKDYGTLTINPITIIIKSPDASKDWDGTPLSDNNWELLSGTLLTGHSLVVNVDNQITNPGSKDNTMVAYVVDQQGNDVSNLYDVQKVTGTLQVLPREITVSTNTYEQDYDGTALLGGTGTIISGTLLGGHTISYGAEKSITNPGTVPNSIPITIYDGNGNDVTVGYRITESFGTLTVRAIPLVLRSPSANKVYDGTPLSNNTWELVSGTTLAGHTLSVTVNNDITYPGSTPNTMYASVVDSNGNDVSSIYDFQYDAGTLTIDPITIILKSPDASKAYDGTPLFNNTWELYNGSLLAGHSLVVSVDNQITNPGTTPNTMNAYVIDGNGNDVSTIYDIQYLTGTLEIFPIDITVTTNSYTKPYDGTALLGGTASLTFGTLLPGHHLEYGTERSITLPGSISNDVTARVFDSNGNDVTVAYNITKDYGTLTVQPITIVLQSPTASKLYDGTPLSDNTWQLVNGSLLAGHTLNVVMNNSITNPGTIDNTMLAYVNDGNGNDVSSIYDIQLLTGTLTIDGIPITISTNDNSKTYDGTPLLGGAATITVGSLMAGDYIVYGSEISITYPQTIANAVGYTIFDANGNDVTALYNVTENYGTLTIQKITIVIKSPDASKIYDGTPLTANTWELVSGAVIAGHTLYVDVDNSITDVGSVPNTMFAYVLDAQGTNVTSYYDIVENTGTLTVLSSAYASSQIATSSFTIPDVNVFQVYSQSSGRVYFRERSFGDYIGSGWTTGVDQNTSITVNPFQYPGTALQEVGLLPTLLQIQYLRDQMPYLSPYFTTDTFTGVGDVHTNGDTSVISNINAILYTYNASDNYTIQDPQLSQDEITYRNYVYQNYLGVPASTKQAMLTLATQNGLSASSPTIISDVQNYIRHAATYNLNFAPIPAGEDVAVYFLTVSKEGICQHFATAATLMYRSLGIPARYVTGFAGDVTASQWTQISSTQAHAWVEVYIDGLGWVPVEVTGSAVDPIAITIQPQTVSQLYSPGTTITASSLQITGYLNFFADGYTYQATYGGSLSTIGTAVSTVDSIRIFDSNGFDVTYQFDITINPGLLQLYGYQIEVVTNGDTKNYDGTALTNSIYSINGSLAANHHVETVTFTGSQTYVGSSKNRATIVIYDDLGNDVTSEYQITYTYGDLVVQPTSITIQSDSGTKIFDGTPLTVDTYSIVSGTLAVTDSVVINITGSQTSIGKSVNTISSVSITNNGVDVTSNYIINTVEGELTVTPY